MLFLFKNFQMAPKFKVKREVCPRLIRSLMINPPPEPFSLYLLLILPQSCSSRLTGLLTMLWTKEMGPHRLFCQSGQLSLRHPGEALLHFLQVLALTPTSPCLEYNPSCSWFSITLHSFPHKIYNHKVYKLILIVRLCLLKFNLHENTSLYLFRSLCAHS